MKMTPTCLVCAASWGSSTGNRQTVWEIEAGTYWELTSSALLLGKQRWTLKLLWLTSCSSLVRFPRAVLCVVAWVRVNEETGWNSLLGLPGWVEDQAMDGIWSCTHVWFNKRGLSLGGKSTGLVALEIQSVARHNPRGMLHFHRAITAIKTNKPKKRGMGSSSQHSRLIRNYLHQRINNH